MDLVIATSGMEETFIKYLLDVVGCSAVLSFLTDYPHFLQLGKGYLLRKEFFEKNNL